MNRPDECYFGDLDTAPPDPDTTETIKVRLIDGGQAECPAYYEDDNPYEQLQAENAQLKAHNRQLLDAIKAELPNVSLRSSLFDALKPPHAKLALAEAAVLKAAEEYLDLDLRSYSALKGQVDKLVQAIKAMKEARGDV
jgi:hypothetical protein